MFRHIAIKQPHWLAVIATRITHTIIATSMYSHTFTSPVKQYDLQASFVNGEINSFKQLIESGKLTKWINCKM